jgi:isoleucyl-tRNA synthetase
MFEEQSGLPDQAKLEKDVLAFWRERRIFDKLREKNRGGPRFSFLDGPITANNPMGIHHARGRTLKDLFQRYWAMRGYDERYQNGFDCQGLWVEVEVERELGFTSKRDIERYGVAEFVERCKERVRRFSDLITQDSVRLGCWMDWEHSYSTDSEANNYAIWHFLKKCHQRGLVYRGADVMPWCPRCGTGLSQQEVQDGYRETTHPGVVVKFPVRGRAGEHLLVWTTTPWTLTANVACAVHPKAAYARVRQGNGVYYLAAERVREVLSQSAPWRVECELPARELVGLEYDGPFDDLPLAAEAAAAHRVIDWDEVSADEGTGIVHIAPGCGKEDYDLGREFRLPTPVPVDEDGRFVPDAGPYGGMAASEAGNAIVASLRERGLLYRVDEYRHRYPHCWRCGSELLFRLVDEWFIAMDPWREEIKRLAREVKWIPAYGRQVELDWLANMGDWMISKKRYWGLALPIWQCECGWFDVIGGKDELRDRAAAGWAEFECQAPHRPWVDAVKVECPECGEAASRIPDVGNPWLDAGIVPYSTMGYFEDPEEWEKWFPADLVVECLPGQFRNWFYALLAMSTMLEGRQPVKTIVGYAPVLDEVGEEMHKSKGNAVLFSEAAEEVGADVVRWMSAAQPVVQPLRFGSVSAMEASGWLRTLWNVYSFFATYANVDRWPVSDLPRTQARTQQAAPLDRWFFARLAAGVDEVNRALTSVDSARATKEILSLLDDVSNWWVRRSRRRFWKSGEGEDKQAAYAALWAALHCVSRLVAPLVSFTAEALYQKLAAPFSGKLPESVHLCAFPRGDEFVADQALLDECARARAAIRLGRAARAQAGIRVRQPLASVFVLTSAYDGERPLPHFEQDVMDELNVKRIEFVADRADLGDAVVEEAGLAVGLDTRIDRDLRLEGIARDLVRHVQNLRKRSGLRVAERVNLWVEPDAASDVERAVAQHAAYLRAETLAESLAAAEVPKEAHSAECRVAGARVRIGLVRAGAGSQ